MERSRKKAKAAYMISAVALDFWHTIIDERVDILLEDTYHEQHLMPGVREALTGLAHPVAIWANTRRANAEDVWRWLQRAGLAAHVTWVVTPSPTQDMCEAFGHRERSYSSTLVTTTFAKSCL